MSESNVPTKIEITDSKLDLIKKTIFRDATDEELALFKYICELRQLDPFARQIYARKQRQYNPKTDKYEETMVVITAIDGFRLNAERSRKYAGQLGPFFTENGVDWIDCWIKSTPPKAAKVAVLRKDFNEPIWAMARFDAYCPRNKDGQPTGQWRTMPDGQIAKCAEALALRRAFPEELSGIYASEEMHQAIDVTATQSAGELTEAETPRARVTLEHDSPHEARELPSPLVGWATAPINVDADGLKEAEAEGASLELEGAASGPLRAVVQDSSPVADGETYPTAEEVRQAFVSSHLTPKDKLDRIEKAIPDFKQKGYAKLDGPERKKVMEALQR